MKNKEKIVKISIGVIIALIMFIPIFKDMNENRLLKTIEMKDLQETISSTASYKYAVIYVDSSEKETIKDSKKEVKKIVDKFKTDEKDVKAYYIDSTELTDNDFNTLGLKKSKSGYVFVANGEILNSAASNIEKKKLRNLVELYTSTGISKDLINYKVAKNAKAYLGLVESKKVTMAVFGRANCYYCQQFLPVYNTVAGDYKLDIYYFDSLNYAEDEYNKIMSAGLKIPASCSESGKEAKLESGFGTPLTLFTKKGKVIDCISGYSNKQNLISKLKKVGLIAEK